MSTAAAWSTADEKSLNDSWQSLPKFYVEAITPRESPQFRQQLQEHSSRSVEFERVIRTQL